MSADDPRPSDAAPPAPPPTPAPNHGLRAILCGLTTLLLAINLGTSVHANIVAPWRAAPRRGFGAHQLFEFVSATVMTLLLFGVFAMLTHHFAGEHRALRRRADATPPR